MVLGCYLARSLFTDGLGLRNVAWKCWDLTMGKMGPERGSDVGREAYIEVEVL